MHKEKGIWVFSEDEKAPLKDECAKRNGFKLLRLKEKTIKARDFNLRKYLMDLEMMPNG